MKPLEGPSIVARLTAAGLLLHLYAAHYYGYFVDELYFLACSRHLAWGYVDMPPLVPGIVWLTRTLLGDSLAAIRVPAMLAGAATIWLAGRLARELGGGRFAQALAALSVLVAPSLLSMTHYVSMNAFEQVLWLGFAFAVARIIRTGNQKLWLWVGLIAGIGLNNKYSILFLGIGITVGLLLTPARAAFAKPWIWLGAAIAFALIVPNLAWNVRNHFPFLELMANIRRTNYNMSFTPLQFFGIQVTFLLPFNLLVWLPGLCWYLFAAEGRRWRALGIAWIVIAAIMFLPNGKPYYLLPAYPMLLAAGGVALEKWLARPRLAWCRSTLVWTLVCAGISALPFALPVLPPELYVRYSGWMHFSPPVIIRGQFGQLPHFFADQFGWPEMAAAVARAYNGLPAEERAKTAILAQRYGEAGAVDLFGERQGLPAAICGHQNYYLWGSRGYSGESAIAYGFSRERLEFWFASVEDAGTVDHPWSPEHEHFTVFHCRAPKRPLQELWPELKNWD
ncbi:MAG TPA: glycosyltransferase family 39 protein [Bryobacteraceae bacterium]|nr:glycosyltransferase family 39 protein [Bryobacteraceae bacterium]